MSLFLYSKLRQFQNTPKGTVGCQVFYTVAFFVDK